MFDRLHAVGDADAIVAGGSHSAPLTRIPPNVYEPRVMFDTLLRLGLPVTQGMKAAAEKGASLRTSGHGVSSADLSFALSKISVSTTEKDQTEENPGARGHPHLTLNDNGVNQCSRF